MCIVSEKTLKIIKSLGHITFTGIKRSKRKYFPEFFSKIENP